MVNYTRTGPRTLDGHQHAVLVTVIEVAAIPYLRVGAELISKSAFGDDGAVVAATAQTLEAVIARKPEPSILAYRQNNLALALTDAGRANEALAIIDAAIQYSRDARLVDLLAKRLDTRVSVLKALGRFDDALSDVRECLGIIEEVRAHVVASDFIKRGYAESAQQSYGAGVGILFQAGRQSEALEFAEQGRARAFLDLLAGRESGATGAMAPAGASVTSLTSSAMAEPLKAPAIERVAARLTSTLLEYWVTTDETLIWLVRPGAPIVSVRVPVGAKKIAELVASTTAPLLDRTTTRGAAGDPSGIEPQNDLTSLPMRGLGLMALARDNRAAWRELNRVLIEPVRAGLPLRGSRLTIVPHGPLFRLSFAALQTAAGRYLLEDYELHYAPSVSVLDFTGRRAEAVKANHGPWAIIGNPATLPMVGDRQLETLPGAAREIAAIADLAPRGLMLRLDGSRADETTLQRTLVTSHPSVVHFATHGFVFDDPARQPFLALNRTGVASGEDGRLTLDEVYGLRLDTDLVVLSACRSGSGQVSSDGVIGLARGFFYAGTASVLATFWDVNDESTERLMVGFYANYAKARGKSASLRSAQLALLRDLRAGRVVITAGGRQVTLPEHPLLWAAFFLSGEP